MRQPKNDFELKHKHGELRVLCYGAIRRWYRAGLMDKPTDGYSILLANAFGYKSWMEFEREACEDHIRTMETLLGEHGYAVWKAICARRGLT